MTWLDKSPFSKSDNWKQNFLGQYNTFYIKNELQPLTLFTKKLKETVWGEGVNQNHKILLVRILSLLEVGDGV